MLRGGFRVTRLWFDALLNALTAVPPERTAELRRRLGLSRAERGGWTPPERLGEGLAWGCYSRGRRW